MVQKWRSITSGNLHAVLSARKYLNDVVYSVVLLWRHISKFRYIMMAI